MHMSTVAFAACSIERSMVDGSAGRLGVSMEFGRVVEAWTWFGLYFSELINSFIVGSSL